MDYVKNLEEQLLNKNIIIEKLEHDNKVLRETLEEVLMEHSRILEYCMDIEERNDELAYKLSRFDV